MNDLPPFRDRLPYIAAVVDLAEGPRLMTTIGIAWWTIFTALTGLCNSLGLMLVVSLVDFYRNRAQAVKFHEYGFVIITGMVGAMFGFVNDFITAY